MVHYKYIKISHKSVSYLKKIDDFFIIIIFLYKVREISASMNSFSIFYIYFLFKLIKNNENSHLKLCWKFYKWDTESITCSSSDSYQPWLLSEVCGRQGSQYRTSRYVPYWYVYWYWNINVSYRFKYKSYRPCTGQFWAIPANTEKVFFFFFFFKFCNFWIFVRAEW